MARGQRRRSSGVRIAFFSSAGRASGTVNFRGWGHSHCNRHLPVLSTGLFEISVGCYAIAAGKTENPEQGSGDA